MFDFKKVLNFLFFRALAFRTIFDVFLRKICHRLRKEYKLVWLLSFFCACSKLLLGIFMVHKMERYTFVIDRMTTSLTLGIIVMDDLSLDSLFICYTLITVTLLAGGLIQFVLILQCWQSLCGSTLSARYLLQRKIERITPGIFFFDGATFLSCAAVACFACMSFSRWNRNIPVSILEQPMLLSLDSYFSNPEIAMSWNQLQVLYECCGVHKNSDWFGRRFREYSHECDEPGFPNNVPNSCCKHVTIDCGRNITNPENIYQVGCLKSLAIHIDQQIQLTIESWCGKCFTFLGLSNLWLGSVCVYVCVYMCRKYRVCIPSATDEKTVKNVEDAEHNNAVKSAGADNDDTKIDIEGECKNSDRSVDVAIAEDNESIEDVCSDTNLYSDDQPPDATC